MELTMIYHAIRYIGEFPDHCVGLPERTRWNQCHFFTPSFLRFVLSCNAKLCELIARCAPCIRSLAGWWVNSTKHKTCPTMTLSIMEPHPIEPSRMATIKKVRSRRRQPPAALPFQQGFIEVKGMEQCQNYRRKGLV